MTCPEISGDCRFCMYNGNLMEFKADNMYIFNMYILLFSKYSIR